MPASASLELGKVAEQLRLGPRAPSARQGPASWRAPGEVSAPPSHFFHFYGQKSLYNRLGIVFSISHQYHTLKSHSKILK